MEELQYFKRSSLLTSIFSTVPSACSYSSLQLCSSVFFSHLAPRFYLKNGNPSFLSFFFSFFFIVIFSCFLPPGTLNKRICILWACARGQLLCPGFTHIISCIAHNMQLWEAFLSPPGRWEMRTLGAGRPGQLKGTPLDCLPCHWTCVCAHCRRRYGE